MYYQPLGELHRQVLFFLMNAQKVLNNKKLEYSHLLHTKNYSTLIIW